MIELKKLDGTVDEYLRIKMLGWDAIGEVGNLLNCAAISYDQLRDLGEFLVDFASEAQDMNDLMAG